MAYADDLSFKDSAAASKTFSRQLQEPNRHTWIDTASTAQEPRIVRIAHRKEALKGKPGEYQDRHTVDFAVTKKDPTTGKSYTITLTCSVQFPLTGPLVRADLDHLLAFAKTASPDGFLTNTTHIDRLLRSEL